MQGIHSYGTDKTEFDILKKELRKKRRIMPLRKMFESIPNLIKELKPCLMMSPLSVSLFLNADIYEFDMVIFDEASQVHTEDAVGAIIRGKQTIIAGDSKQLPPTNFFVSSTSEDDFDDEEYDVDLYESILDEASTVLPERILKWHYRSRDESLITFSNRKIYDDNLITFPSAIRRSKNNGVEFIYVDDGVYDRGGKKCNKNEAKKVADLVFEHIVKFPQRTLGVITFSESQQNAIEDEIIRLRKNMPEYEYFFQEKSGEFFVKNLENVQGDERDTIIFSIGYAKDSKGIMHMNFGPLSQKGGYRRLNVAITRAKYNVKLVSSIYPTDIAIERTNSDGVKMLRSYMEYAIQGPKSSDHKRTEGDIEVSASELEETIYDFLNSNGYEVKRNVGCSGHRIDMAIVDPKVNGRFILGIECDGATYHSAKTARERDRLRQSILKEMGWKIYRIWSMDWINYPEVERERLIKAINQAIDLAEDIDVEYIESDEECEIEEESKIDKDNEINEYSEINGYSEIDENQDYNLRNMSPFNLEEISSDEEVESDTEMIEDDRSNEFEQDIVSEIIMPNLDCDWEFNTTNTCTYDEEDTDAYDDIVESSQINLSTAEVYQEITSDETNFEDTDTVCIEVADEDDLVLNADKYTDTDKNLDTIAETEVIEKNNVLRVLDYIQENVDYGAYLKSSEVNEWFEKYPMDESEQKAVNNVLNNLKVTLIEDDSSDSDNTVEKNNIEKILDYVNKAFRFGSNVKFSEIKRLFKKYQIDEVDKLVVFDELKDLNVNIKYDKLPSKEVKRHFSQINEKKEILESEGKQLFYEGKMQPCKQRFIQETPEKEGYKTIYNLTEINVNYQSYDIDKSDEVCSQYEMDDTYDFEFLDDEDLCTTFTDEEFISKVDNMGNIIDKRFNIKYLKQFQTSDGYKKNEALRNLVKANERLVAKIARNYEDAATVAFNSEDMYQCGMQGLMRSAERFDVSLGYKFSTYATWWIRQSITRGIADYSTSIRIPVHMRESVNKYNNLESKLYYELGREATDEELAKHMNVTVKQINDIRYSRRIGNICSLETPIGDDGGSQLIDFVEDNESESLENIVMRKELKCVFEDIMYSHLNDKEKKVIELRFGLEDGENRTLEEVGKYFDITRERIRQVEAKVLSKMRKRINREKLEDFLDEYQK
ncbi:MAG: sigma-70 family RNA polymerase sigma factor [Clostridioides sp.]|jgi:RNA polymerase sigma factor (sigma-70 family)|nr:sigma-70 family RNA polymerase sigma factor [Clostridioides sp.]